MEINNTVKASISGNLSALDEHSDAISQEIKTRIYGALRKHRLFTARRSPKISCYLLVGAISTGVHYSVMFLLIMSIDNPILASTVGAVFGLVIGYFLNLNFTFVDASFSTTSLVRYTLIAFSMMIVNAFVLKFLHSGLALPLWTSQLAATTVITLLGFSANRNWSFPK